MQGGEKWSRADIKPEYFVEINRMAKLMQEHHELNFEVQGQCDNAGHDEINDPLSQKRADAIVKALTDKGIAASCLTAVGKDSHSPIASDTDDDGRTKKNMWNLSRNKGQR